MGPPGVPGFQGRTVRSEPDNLAVEGTLFPKPPKHSQCGHSGVDFPVLRHSLAVCPRLTSGFGSLSAGVIAIVLGAS